MMDLGSLGSLTGGEGAIEDDVQALGNFASGRKLDVIYLSMLQQLKLGPGSLFRTSTSQQPGKERRRRLPTHH